MVAPHRVSGVATIAAPSAATGGSTSATNASSAKSVMVASVAANAPADLLRQLNDFRVYSEELETEVRKGTKDRWRLVYVTFISPLQNEELRAKLAAWEERLADGEKRHELARRRLEEQLQTRVIELEKRSKVSKKKLEHLGTQKKFFRSLLCFLMLSAWFPTDR